MLPVLLVDLGLAAILLGGTRLLFASPSRGAERRRAGALALGGSLLAAAGFLLPARVRRSKAVRGRLDQVMPRWHFVERHEIRIRASAARVEAAIRTVTAREIALFRLLTWLRRPRLPGSKPAGDILSPPPDQPILAVALGSGFHLLAEEPGRELVFGALVVSPRASGDGRGRHLDPTPAGAERLRAADGPGQVKAVMSFRWSEQGTTTHLATETRVFATDRRSCRLFALYWRTIYPGSSLIRHSWLRAIRRRAESAQRSGGRSAIRLIKP